MTGLRISELGSLSWDQVDLAKGEIRLAAQNTKTKRSRVIPINRELRTLLERLPRFSDGLVFHGPQGGRVKPDKVRTKLVHRVLKPLAARFPKEGKGKSFIDGRLHSFRHYFCSTCANSHVPELTVRNWLGHRDSRMI